MNLKSLILTILLVASPFQAFAAAVEVDSLQLPAWVERAGQRMAIRPGTSLLAGDQIRTGENGKVLLKLSEGSDLKLGENLEAKIETLKPAEDLETGIFESTFNILRGAFRFTTAQVSKGLNRDIQFQFGTATAGIRGTDLWGKSNAQDRFFVLIEGKIDLQLENNPIIKMEQPLTIFRASQGNTADAIKAVDMDDLSGWAAETELDAGRGVISKTGRYVVYLSSIQNYQWAVQTSVSFQQAGYPVDTISTTVNQAEWTRLGIKGFVSAEDARFFKNQASQLFGIEDAWISRI